MKRTVAHLLPNHNPFPPTYPAGTELRVEMVSRRQVRYRPVVVCGWFEGQADTEELSPMRIRRIRVGRVYRRLFQKITRLDPFPYVERMRRILQDEQAAIAHIHNEPKLLSGLAPRLAQSSLPVVVHVANEKPLPRSETHRVARWIACSRYIQDWLERDNAIPADRIQVIYTGVDAAARPPRWRVSDSMRAGLRQGFGVVDPQATVLLFAGRLVKEKGVRELLDAYERLRRRTPRPIVLLVAGNVRDSDDPDNEKAVYGKAVTKRMASMEGVRWVGSLRPDQMHDFLLAGDVFVMPSLWNDPFPTVMLEAAAAGLPIVAPARGGIAEFLEGCTDFSFVTDAADPDAIATGILRYVESPGARESAGHWLRERVERAFGWDRVCGEFEDLYDRLLQDPRRLRAAP
ncbi:MAG TPA: glycosyltransferase family 4 protein [Burkholderiales bacterium]|nr:glycosyltransferase family 4 protein [Burkholderiales bacterium]